jgi:multidrug efflux system membrane fusion protein
MWTRSEHNARTAAEAAAAPLARGVPVVGTAAKLGDLPVYLDGLGNVTALNTVTVQARVSGQLVKVAYREGQTVQAGDLLCEIDPRPYQVQLTQFEGTLERDEALFQNASLELARDEQAKEAIPQQTIDTQNATVLQYQGDVKSDQGQVDAINLDLTYCNITAPISGRVGLRQVDQGNMITTTTNLVVITQLQPITVVFNLPEDNIPLVQAKLHAGQKLSVLAYNHDFSKKLAEGSLLALDNEVNGGTGTLQFKAIFANQDDSLFPSQFVNVRLLLDTLTNVVLVPTVAVQLGPTASFVYVVKPDHTVEQRTVVPGHVEGDQEAIQKGLSAGEVVVTDGFDKLQQGTKVVLSAPGSAPASSE